MIHKAFLDSDVVLDLATGREPFVEHSKTALSKEFLRTLLQYVSAVPVDHGAIIRALESKFYDFEYGVQHFCALQNQCDFIVTRNSKHSVMSELKVLEPKEFVALYV